MSMLKLSTGYNNYFTLKKNPSNNRIYLKLIFLSEFDKLVRQNLVFMVVDRVNDSISVQRNLQNDCASLVNHTADNCRECQQ